MSFFMRMLRSFVSEAKAANKQKSRNEQSRYIYWYELEDSFNDAYESICKVYQEVSMYEMSKEKFYEDFLRAESKYFAYERKMEGKTLDNFPDIALNKMMSMKSIYEQLKESYM